jgi:prepilin-type N-terminal cleavage/methylation domain-containing protein
MFIKRSFISGLNQAGDTIVEVLVVLAILGLALSISYATANRSLLNVRQAQEHAQALQLVQGQLEQFRSLVVQKQISSTTVSDTSTTVDPSDNDEQYVTSATDNPVFCINASGTIERIGNISDYTTYPTDCAGANNDNLDDLYNIAISYNSSNNTYTAQATWPSVTDAETDKVSLTYRIYVTYAAS